MSRQRLSILEQTRRMIFVQLELDFLYTNVGTPWDQKNQPGWWNEGVDCKINPAWFQGKATVALTKRSCGSASGWVSRSRCWSPSPSATSPVRNAGNDTRATTPPDGRFRRHRGPPGPSHRRRPVCSSAPPRREVNRGRTTSPYNAEIRRLNALIRFERADVNVVNETMITDDTLLLRFLSSSTLSFRPLSHFSLPPLLSFVCTFGILK